ncbi:uncharacterized protein B0I36DRAFT_325861 [Microdochium trichocladiopsis]|uniref:Uncharacterized protein n=1 Tax=Microdochium trichocladiopsis TaxID=1682393 RepID=A0A9P8Y5N0_9PEZI|nr:uncharacterized protein B0I36DRAFT_325861 [Microdochium trichocladiopsis]KAH7029490.1 hypothetical protein B0I36DRAFT_325861 [Microdochium trichocladiopsis]
MAPRSHMVGRQQADPHPQAAWRFLATPPRAALVTPGFLHVPNLHGVVDPWSPRLAHGISGQKAG